LGPKEVLVTIAHVLSIMKLECLNDVGIWNDRVLPKGVG
jgi:hypothetical protein